MKKFTTLIICLLMLVTCGLAGCASFSIDKVKYYNEVVAKVGKTEITRHELLAAYDSYGYSYYTNNMGQSKKEALNSTLDLLIDRESLYQYTLSKGNQYRPKPYQVNNIIENMYDELDETMDSYITRAKNILNIKNDDNTNNDDNKTSYSHADYLYSKRAEVKFDSIKNKYYIDYTYVEDTSYEAIIDVDLTKFDTLKADTIEAIRDAYLDRLEDNLTVDEGENANAIKNKVLSLFTDSLINYEEYLRDKNGNAYNKNTDDLLYRYFERTFDSEIKSQYLTNLRTEYLENENLNIDLLLQEYDYLVRESHDKYDNKESKYIDDMINIGTNGDSVYYHPELENEELGYFIHTLINFTEDQKTTIKNLDNIIDEDERELAYQNIINELNDENNKVIVKRTYDATTDTYIEDGETATLSEVITEYNKIKDYNYNDRIKKFIEFMFTYTGDADSTLKAGMPYVVGVNNSGMETAFTNEAVKLMQTGTIGAMSDVDITNIDSMCITSYGIHFIMYVENVTAYDLDYSVYTNAYIQSDNKSTDPDGIYNLCEKTLNPLTGETYFDMLFDIVYPASSDNEYTSNTGYTDYENDLISNIQEQNKVTKYTTRINGTNV